MIIFSENSDKVLKAVEAKDYIINIAGLKAGKHRFDLSADASLFEEFNPDLLEEANLKVELELQKSERMIEANIFIDGLVSLVCDRSLRVYEEDLSTEERVFFKFGEEAKELSEDVMIIPHQQQEIDFLQLVYELVSITIPMKKLHPDYRDDDEDWVYMSEDEPLEDSEEQNTMADPRWEALKRLKSDK